MKFVCDACSARYVIDDERVRGKVLRIRCKKCGNIMEVREPIRPAEASGNEAPAHARRATAAFERPNLEAALAAAAEPPIDEQPWYYSINGESFGPYREDELIERFQTGSIGDEAFLWQSGFDDWKPSATIPVFSAAMARGRRSARRAGSATMSLDADELASLRASAEAAIASSRPTGDAKQRAEREAREKAEREAREQAEREAREQAELDAREKAEREAREKAEREAREQAEREAREQAEREAREQAEREAREQAEREAREQAEREAREQAEREAREKAEREAREQAEARAKAEAERQERERAEAQARAEREETERRLRAEREEADRRARAIREEEKRKETERLAEVRRKRLAGALHRAAQASLSTPTVSAADSGGPEEPSGDAAPVGVGEAVTEPVPLPEALLARSRRPMDSGDDADDADEPTPPAGTPAIAPPPEAVDEDLAATADASDPAATPPIEEPDASASAGAPAVGARDDGDATEHGPADEDAAEASAKVSEVAEVDDEATPPSGSSTVAEEPAEPPADPPADPPASVPEKKPAARRAPKAAPVAPSKPASDEADAAALFDLTAPIDGAPMHTVGAPTVDVASDSERPNRAPLLLAIAAVLATLAIGWYFLQKPATPPAPRAVAAADASGAEASPAPDAALPREGSDETAEGSGEAVEMTPQQLARIADNYRLAYRRTDRAMNNAIDDALEAVISELSAGRTENAVSANRLDQLAEQQARRARAAERETRETRTERSSTSSAGASATEPARATNTRTAEPQGVFGQLGTPALTPTSATPRTGRAEQAQSATAEQFQRGLSTFVQASIGRCKTRAIADEGDLPANRAELEIRVLNTGRVESVDAGRAFAGSSFQRCLQSHSGRWNFGEFAGDPITLRRTYILQ